MGLLCATAAATVNNNRELQYQQRAETDKAQRNNAELSRADQRGPVIGSGERLPREIREILVSSKQQLEPRGERESASLVSQHSPRNGRLRSREGGQAAVRRVDWRALCLDRLDAGGESSSQCLQEASDANEQPWIALGPVVVLGSSRRRANEKNCTGRPRCWWRVNGRKGKEAAALNQSTPPRSYFADSFRRQPVRGLHWINARWESKPVWAIYCEVFMLFL